MIRFHEGSGSSEIELLDAAFSKAEWTKLHSVAVRLLERRGHFPASEFLSLHPFVRISAIVDARFSLIVDGETASSRVRRGGAQAPGRNVAQPSTISLKRSAARGVAGPVLGLD